MGARNISLKIGYETRLGSETGTSYPQVCIFIPQHNSTTATTSALIEQELPCHPSDRIFRAIKKLDYCPHNDLKNVPKIFHCKQNIRRICP